MAAQGRDIKLSVQRVEGYRNFATKIWNAARFAEMNGCKRVDGIRSAGGKGNAQQMGARAKPRKPSTRSRPGSKRYKFNEAALAAYRFVWNVFCDWTLELAKPVLQGADSPAKVETQRDHRVHLRRDQQAAAPLHAVHDRGTVGDQGRGGAEARNDPCARALVAISMALIDPASEAEIGWVVDLVNEVRSARSETNVPAGAQIPLVLVCSVGKREGSRGPVGRHLAAPCAICPRSL